MKICYSFFFYASCSIFFLIIQIGGCTEENAVKFLADFFINLFLVVMCVCVRVSVHDSSMVVRSAKAGRWAWPSRTTTTGSSWATSPRTGTGTSSTRTLTSLHVSLEKNRKKSIRTHAYIIQTDTILGPPQPSSSVLFVFLLKTFLGWTHLLFFFLFLDDSSPYL